MNLMLESTLLESPLYAGSVKRTTGSADMKISAEAWRIEFSTCTDIKFFYISRFTHNKIRKRGDVTEHRRTARGESSGRRRPAARSPQITK
jgi:hypothetical protein